MYSLKENNAYLIYRTFIQKRIYLVYQIRNIDHCINFQLILIWNSSRRDTEFLYCFFFVMQHNRICGGGDRFIRIFMEQEQTNR